jgi:hypothetical protein
VPVLQEGEVNVLSRATKGGSVAGRRQTVSSSESKTVNPSSAIALLTTEAHSSSWSSIVKVIDPIEPFLVIRREKCEFRSLDIDFQD